MLCEYKNLFGPLGTGIHSYRIYNVAVLDVLVTIFVAYLIQLFIFPQYKYIYVLTGFFLLGIFVHYIFCVETTVHKFVFPKQKKA